MMVDNQTHLAFAYKLLDLCQCDADASIYSLLPSIDYNTTYLKGIYAHCLQNLPNIVDCGIEIFTQINKKKNSRNSFEYLMIKKEKDNFINQFSVFNDLFIKNRQSKISSDLKGAVLSYLSHIYLDCFNRPVQFFIPDSTLCSGQWEMWNSFDYLKFMKNISNNNFMISLRNNLINSDIWQTKIGLDNISYSIYKRLTKEEFKKKKLDPLSMIKALVIRIGEFAKPIAPYEVVDHAVRVIVRHMNIDYYLKVDRELEFCKRFEQELAYSCNVF